MHGPFGHPKRMKSALALAFGFPWQSQRQLRIPRSAEEGTRTLGMTPRVGLRRFTKEHTPQHESVGLSVLQRADTFGICDRMDCINKETVPPAAEIYVLLDFWANL